MISNELIHINTKNKSNLNDTQINKILLFKSLNNHFTLTKLDLSNCQIKDITVFKFLENNYTLTKLNLSFN